MQSTQRNEHSESDAALFNDPADQADLALEQEAFWDACLSTLHNLILSARAGTGKTYSILEAARRLLASQSSLRIVVLAFNKSIADEMKEKVRLERLPVEVGTSHAICLEMIRGSLSYPAVETDREKKILKALNLTHKDDVYHVAQILQSVKLFCDENREPISPDQITERLVLFVARELSFDIEDLGRARSAVAERLARPMHPDFPRSVDFADMLRLPLLWSKSRPEVDVVFVDEAQDLSAIQHLLIERCFPRARVIGVGDPHQAIYAFRGAMSDSMDQFQKAFDCRLFPLTRTRRCPSSVVSVARKLVPDFQAMPDAIEGRVAEIERIQYVPGALALSRRNAPIIRTALSLLRMGHPVSASSGSSGGESDPIQSRLSNLHKRVCLRGSKAATISELHANLDDHVWKESEAIERRFKGKEDDSGFSRKISDLKDLASCYRSILDDAAIGSSSGSSSASGVNEAVNKVMSKLFTRMKGPEVMRFLTVHRAKGLESKNVFIIEPELMPIYDFKAGCYPGQEPNIAYVAFTRSMENLYWVGGTPPILVGRPKKEAWEIDELWDKERPVDFDL